MYYIFYDPIYEGSNKWGITNLENVTFTNTLIESYNKWLINRSFKAIFGSYEKTINGYFEKLKSEVSPDPSAPELIVTINSIEELPILYPELFI